MSRAATSVCVFSLVFLNGGLGLLLAPQFVLSLLGLTVTELLFPRLLGMAMLVLAYYYIRAARQEVIEFFVWTVHARLAGVAFYAVFVISGVAPLAVLGFALMDLLGALWTRWALHADRQSSTTTPEPVERHH